ncbi:MAG: hypothetical protein J6K90_01750 [Tidjanibacter sp.]|nr:hypothetical protein [Tidjanibacter sp.]MBR6831760.1 hypothetical protein [Tidjanibacter sp.]
MRDYNSKYEEDNYENNYDYNPEDDNYDYYQDGSDNGNTMKGYKILIVILIVILGAVSFLYFKQVQNLKADFAIERDTLANRITNLISDMDNIQATNDSMSVSLSIERGKADSLYARLLKERSTSRATIRQYEKEIGTLKTVMQNYIRQIDSLNRLNESLAAENIQYRKQVTSERLRAEAAEERAAEADAKIRVGSIVKAREINIVTLNSSNKEVTRASRATRLRIDFVISANELTNPGNRNVYVRVTGPDGYIMANSDGALFPFEGDQITYSAVREIDYQNGDLPVSIYYSDSAILAGTYLVQVYMDGYMVGSSEVLLK